MAQKSKKPALILSLIASIILAFIGNRMMYLFNSYTDDGTILDRLTAMLNVFSSIAENPRFFYFESPGIIGIIAGAAIPWLVFLYFMFAPSKHMYGREHGSAAWGTPKDIENYIDPDYQNNLLLTATERLSMSDRMKRTKTDDFNRNKNVLVIGGSGSGKTRFYVKPNLMQLHSSYVITDPKGTLIHEVGKMFADAGYKVKVFDLINRDKSDLYNPFAYLMTEDDILKLINNLITNTNSPQSKSAGDFWEKSEIALLEAIFGYILFEARPEDRTIGTAMEMIRLAEVKEDDEDYKSPLDILFDELKERNPDHFAVKQYEIYKFAAGKTAKSILISVGVRLAPFNIASIQHIVSGDTLELDQIGSEKTALFVIIPDTDRSFNFLAAMMFQQLFDILVYRADNDYKGRLPFPVRCIMDEFANIGQIPQLDILISTIRSRRISLNIIIQNLAQIKNLYKDTWEVITGNCDTLLFLGGMEQSTLEYISKMCGKMTLDNRSTSTSKGMNSSWTTNDQNMGRELITPDEVGAMKGRTCILKIRGCNPFMSQKFNIEDHANYKLLADADETNWFNIEDRAASAATAFLSTVNKIETVDLSELNQFIKS